MKSVVVVVMSVPVMMALVTMPSPMPAAVAAFTIVRRFVEGKFVAYADV
jgi:hypothetical protein